MKELGVDVSKWQGEFNFALAKSEGARFAIIKAGGGDAGLYTDSQFLRNYQAAKSINLWVGAYWFSKALTVSDAQKEAEYFYNLVKDKKFELPLYIDVENKQQLSVGKRMLTDIIKTWCKYLEERDCFVGIYSSGSFFDTYMFKEELKEYAFWVAQWSKNLLYDCGMWQFGGETNLIRSNKMAGVICDQDYMLIDYPTAIKSQGKNGYGNFKKQKGVPIVSPSAAETVKNVGINASAQAVIDVAISQIGYKEKISNSDLDQNSANAGSGNWTKYARDLDNITGFYNGKKNGYAWCDIFTDWCFVKAFGVDNAKKLLCQPDYSAGAGCTYSMGYYKTANQFFSEPKVGDQIFFKYGSDPSSHTGIVVNVDDARVYTVEGNTNWGDGEGVYKCNYALNDSHIVGYGRPNYASISVSSSIEISAISLGTNQEIIKTIQSLVGTQQTGVYKSEDGVAWGEVKSGDLGSKVQWMQQLLINKGYSVGIDGADGDFGPNTAIGLRRFQASSGLEVNGICTGSVLQKLLE